MSAAELNGRLTVGVLQHLENQPEYVASYYQKANQLRGF
jgi:hypothetical protein